MMLIREFRVVDKSDAIDKTAEILKEANNMALRYDYKIKVKVFTVIKYKDKIIETKKYDSIIFKVDEMAYEHFDKLYKTILKAETELIDYESELIYESTESWLNTECFIAVVVVPIV